MNGPDINNGLFDRVLAVQCVAFKRKLKAGTKGLLSFGVEDIKWGGRCLRTKSMLAVNGGSVGQLLYNGKGKLGY